MTASLWAIMGPMTRRRRSRDQRWAPFPVQDWHRYARTSEAWRRTRRTPRTALALAVTLIVLGAAVLVWADLPARSSTPTGARLHPWVPADGDNSPVTLTRDGAPVHAQLGTAILATPETTQSVPFGLGVLLLGATGAELDRTIWRSTLAVAGHDEFQLWNASGEIRLLATSHPEPRGFTDGILVLGADPAVGQTWESSGMTVEPVRLEGEVNEAPSQPWQASFTAGSDPDPDCLTITGQLLVSSEDPLSLSYRWCRGRGPVEMVWGQSRVVAAEHTAAVPATADPTPAAHPDPAEWVGTSRTAATVLPRIGAEQMSGTPGSVLDETASGRVVVTAGSDVIVLDPTDDLLVARHRLHGGGRVVAVEVFGDLVLVSTDARRLVAFDTITGAELWRRDLPDTTSPQLSRIDEQTAAVPLANGQVWAIDLHDGSSRWEQSTLVSARPPVATADGVVLVLSPAADVLALDAATGDLRWRAQPDAAVIDNVAIGGGLAWIFTDEGLFLHELESGRLTGRGRGGLTAQVRTVDGQPLVWVPGTELRAVAPDGTGLWREPFVCEDAEVQADTVICWSVDGIVAIDRTGTVVARHQIIDHVVDQLEVTTTMAGVMWRTNRAPGTDGPTSWEVYTWHR